MKKILLNLSVALVSIILFYSCKGMYDNLEDYSQESIYPAKYDTIIGKIGFERVELELLKAGRLSSKSIYMGKAKKTVVEYDQEKLVIDSVVSWVNVPNLKVSKLYRFKVYTEDEYGNKSVPQEIGLIPYTETELSTIAVQSPRILAAPSTVILDWGDKMSSILLNYCDLKYFYQDKDGLTREGARGANPRIFAGNLMPGQKVVLNVEYRVVPKINGETILDTVVLKQPVSFNMPLASSVFQAAEPDVLKKNGVVDFTANGVSTIKKLVFPIHSNSLQDLFYFSNLDEIDLTGGNLFSMNTISYNRLGIIATLGGGDFVPYARRVGDMPDVNARFLVDMLENNLVKKVKYIANSYGIDHLLKDYIESGVVELVDLPNEADIPFKFIINGNVQAANWKIDLELDPGAYPAGAALNNIFKVTLRDRASSFAFVLPKEYEFNVDQYNKLKFKVYTPDKGSFSGSFYVNYQRIWPRFMNYLWAFSTESVYGQQLWNTVVTNYKIADNDLQKWVDMEVDLSTMKGKHNRVIVINIGGEPVGTFAPTKDMIYYFANFRLIKK